MYGALGAEAVEGHLKQVAAAIGRLADVVVQDADFGHYSSITQLSGIVGAHQTTLNGTRRPSRYHRGLRRVFWYSAFVAIRYCPASKAFYQKKKNEGKHHQQAILALARRRTDVLWATIRDNTLYEPR